MRPLHGGSKPSTNPLGLLFSSWPSAPVSDVICKQILKGHVMEKMGKRKSPIELADLILKHNPGASMDKIADIISEWGDLSDDVRLDAHKSTGMECSEKNRQPQMQSMYIKFTQPIRRASH
jgi:hypothetical protein